MLRDLIHYFELSSHELVVMKPKISVIVPVFNAEAYLAQCLQSIINQSYINLDIVVINDGSTDKSVEIIKEFAKIDARIVHITQINSGISHARNIGIGNASGEFVVFVDSDDWVDVDFVKKMYEGLKEHDLIACGYKREFRNLSLSRNYGANGEFSSYDFKSLLICPMIDGKIDPGTIDALTTVWAKLYRLSLIRKYAIEFVSLKDIGTGEDLLFNLSYINHSTSTYIIDEPLYHYRKYNDNSITARYKYDLKSKWHNLYSAIESLIDSDLYHKSIYEYRRAISTIGLGLNELNNPNGFLQFTVSCQKY